MRYENLIPVLWPEVNFLKVIEFETIGNLPCCQSIIAIAAFLGLFTGSPGAEKHSPDRET
jgi:aspartate-semialdehyde dehydrogenase